MQILFLIWYIAFSKHLIKRYVKSRDVYTFYMIASSRLGISGNNAPLWEIATAYNDVTPGMEGYGHP